VQVGRHGLGGKSVPPEAAIAEEEGQIEGRGADGVGSSSLALG